MGQQGKDWLSHRASHELALHMEILCARDKRDQETDTAKFFTKRNMPSVSAAEQIAEASNDIKTVTEMPKPGHAGVTKDDQLRMVMHRLAKLHNRTNNDGAVPTHTTQAPTQTGATPPRVNECQPRKPQKHETPQTHKCVPGGSRLVKMNFPAWHRAAMTLRDQMHSQSLQNTVCQKGRKQCAHGMSLTINPKRMNHGASASLVVETSWIVVARPLPTEHPWKQSSVNSMTSCCKKAHGLQPATFQTCTWCPCCRKQNVFDSKWD